ncbi:MAG: hypothetical protein ACYC1T_11310 [Sulfuricaulis sp.]
MDWMRQMRAEAGATWLTLFASTGTLICCALPILLVTLGLGAAVASLTSSFPILITLSQHKAWIFAGSGALLVLAGWLMYRPGRACPADPAVAELCARLQIWNRRIYWSAVAIWGVGFAAAYLALPIRIWLDA